MILPTLILENARPMSSIFVWKVRVPESRRCTRESKMRIGMVKARVEPFRGSDGRGDWRAGLLSLSHFN